MAIKKIKSIKKPPVKTIAARSKKTTQNSKIKIALARINVNIPKSLHNKAKQLALKNKITIKEIVTAAIKEYTNKPVLIKTVFGT